MKAQDLASTLERVTELKKTYFRDLWFSTYLDDNAFIFRLHRRADAIRFRLEEETNLHFSSIRITVLRDNGEVDFLAPDNCTIEAGEGWNGIPHDINTLFNFAATHVTVQTTKEQPFLDLRFESCVVLSIEINNRNDDYRARAWSMCIDAQDGGDWQVLTSHRDRVKEFRSYCLQSAPATMAPELVSKAVDLVISAHDQDPDLLPKIDKFEVLFGSEAQLLMTGMLNKDVLSKQWLEITPHGIHRTFRFCSNSEIQTAIRFAADVMDDLFAAGYESFFCFGTLLGLVRENKLIDHDDDIDIAIVVDKEMFESEDAAIKTVSQIMRDRGYDVAGDFVNHCFISKQNSGAAVDAFVLIKDAESLGLYPSKTSDIEISRVLPTFKSNFYATECRIPRDPFTFLRSIYGENWRVPIKNFSHSWTRGNGRLPSLS